jgi:hypothetical protein
MKRHPTGAYDSGFRCGDHVYLADNPRHIGRVDAVISGTVKIVWLDNGWIEYHPLGWGDLILHHSVKNALYDPDVQFD